MQKSMVVFTFLFLTANTFFGVNVVEKAKIVTLSLNFVPAIIKKNWGKL